MARKRARETETEETDAPAESGHVHTCSECGHVWTCAQKKCEVEKAAGINKQGPLCELCWHLTMARNLVRVRGVYESLGAAVAAWPCGWQCWELKKPDSKGGADGCD